MTKTRQTQNGKKTITEVAINDGLFVYFSKANVKSESTFMTVKVKDESGQISKVKLDGRQVAALRRIIA